MPLPGNPVNEACQRIEKALSKHFNETTAPKPVLEAIQAGVDMYNNYTGKAKCLNLGKFEYVLLNLKSYFKFGSIANKRCQITPAQKI